MFKYDNITFGCDPELFLKNKKTKQFTPVCGLIGGTKEKPKKIGRKGHAIQEDNVMVEFNIPPAKSAEEVVHSVQYVLNHLTHRLPLFDLVIEASATFSKELLSLHPQAAEFGCDPDYNAWTMTINERPDPNTTLRTCGGHIHVGYNHPDMDNQTNLIKAMDLFVGIPLVVLDPDKVRKTRYGKAGAFRPKDYDIEWRVGSNHWIKTPELITWAYNNTMKAVKYLNDGNGISVALGNMIQNTLNTGDERVARNLSDTFHSLEGI